MHNKNKPMLIVIIRDKVEIGSEIPRSGYSVLMIAPVNIKQAILNPTENNIVSVIVILSSLRTLNIMNPGINVRYIKPIICLKRGISNIINKYSIKWITKITLINFIS